jgi:hypothetical protein
MWPYNHDEHIWLEPSKDWAKGRLQTIPLLTPANDDTNGAWPYITADDRRAETRPVDPQIFLGK